MLTVICLWLMVLPCCAATGLCPAGCVCPSETQVLCTGAGLRAPPPGLPATVQHLSLAGNRIRRLRTAAFQHLSRLRTLILDDNRIQHVAPFAFLGLVSLERLSLQRNPLGELGPFSLSGIRNITYLYLSHSGVRRVRPRAFSTSGDVKLLLLSGNPAAALDAGAFSGLRRVDHLLLPEQLSRLGAGAFSGLSEVGSLRLRQPALSRLPAGAFSGLRRVAYLSLEDGDLGRLEPGWTDGLGPVGRLNIAGNVIHELSGLNVSDAVGRLEFRRNQVLGVAHSDVLAFAASSRVSIEDNYFPCTCQLHRVTAALRACNYSVARFARANLCLTPLRQHKQRISEAELPLAATCAARDRAEEEQRKSEEVRLRSGAARRRPRLPLALSATWLLLLLRWGRSSLLTL